MSRASLLFLLSLVTILSLAHACPDACYCVVRHVWCHEARLTELPAGIEQTVHYLDLGGNDISRLPPMSLVPYPNLRSVILGKNRLSYIPDYTFGNMTFMETLHLDNNNITKVAENGFKGLGGLRTLGLSGNRLTEVPSVALRQIRNLRHLDLSNNNIHNLVQHSFADVPYLESLNLSSNCIEKIDKESICSLRRMKHLDLSNACLYQVPRQALVRLDQLQTLNLAGNNLKRISVFAFGAQIYLKSLDLSMNKITYVSPDAFINGCSLQKLSLQGNSLSAVPTKAFKPMKNLENVQLGHNRIRRVAPGELDDFPTVKVLGLDGNQIRSVSSRLLTRLPKFQALDISDNPLSCDCNLDTFLRWADRKLISVTHSEAGWRPYRDTCDAAATAAPVPEQEPCPAQCRCLRGPFSFCGPSDSAAQYVSVTCGRQGPWELASVPTRLPTRTRNLYLDGNKIAVVREEQLLGVPELEALSLQDNQLTEVPVDALRAVPDLKYLLLANNPISDVPAFAFAWVPGLTALNLANTSLTAVPSKALRLPRNLTTLQISGHIKRLTAVTFVGMSSLENLVMDHNCFKSIDDVTFEPLVRLVRLGLSNACLRDIPVLQLERLPELLYLDLSKNTISDVSDGAFIGNQRLRELNLANNEISRVSPSAFVGLAELQKLDMRHNRLPSVHIDALLAMAGNLEVLDYSFNRIRQVPDLSVMPQLTEVYLDHNELGYLNTSYGREKDILYHPVELLSLDYNPLICDCRARDLRRWMDSKQIDLSPLRGFQGTWCAAPERLYGRSLKSVFPAELCLEKQSGSPHDKRTRFQTEPRSIFPTSGIQDEISTLLDQVLGRGKDDETDQSEVSTSVDSQSEDNKGIYQSSVDKVLSRLSVLSSRMSKIDDLLARLRKKPQRSRR
ncbi:uncharacterized protein LOC144902489 [Branchiostoma floridae x Branchiostoma belcheri]